MMVPSERTTQDRHKYACSLCARRKVKCDKTDPCSNCVKAKAQCIYETPPPPRPRKRAADEELLARLAAYETLMRKHGIDFTDCATTWLPSGHEGPVKEIDSPVDQNVILPLRNVFDSSDAYVETQSNTVMEKSLWSSLIPELKNPPVRNFRHIHDPFLHPTPRLESILTTTSPSLQSMHPEPKHIYKYWQIFVERVNPLIKFIHVPTTQQRVLDASWDLANIPDSFTALLFSIYIIAVTALSPKECEEYFKETRATLMTRYRTAALRALFAVDFLSSRNFEVLQAFVLFLFSNPESELTSTLTSAAIRIGQKMSLHRPHNPKHSFFENEMRIRLWWNLSGLDARSKAVHVKPVTPPSPREFGDIRLPLNVNDAELHPDMTEAPAEHDNPTEMICVLVKFQVFEWARAARDSNKIFESLSQPSHAAKVQVAFELKEAAIKELEDAYDRILQRSDNRIPLHRIAQTMAKIILCRLRFKIQHPQLRTPASDGNVYMSREESASTFEAVLVAMEMTDLSLKNDFASYLVTHLTFWFKMHAYVYIISELRQRCSGPQIDLAWKIIEALYDNIPGFVPQEDETFFNGLLDLTLEAWEARRRELLRNSGVQEADITPQFIKSIQDMRRERHEEGMSMAAVLDSHGFDGFGLTDGDGIDWQSWNDIFRF